MSEERFVALKKSDWLIILVLALLPIFIKAVYYFAPATDICFQIKQLVEDKEVVEQIEYSQTKTKVIHGKIGDMLLEFDKEKGVRVASSTCPCQVCVNYGWTKNETLVCVPNAVLIQPISGENESTSNKFDAISR
ncbi:MAG: NusG domain II-containing protein [Candidatus Riflebacteria bacterium]|nr:NusG domain II-containing protein [Candidatus Riflebacteria bacterium]